MLNVSARTLSVVRTLRRASHRQDVSMAALACGRVGAALILSGPDSQSRRFCFVRRSASVLLDMNDCPRLDPFSPLRTK